MMVDDWNERKWPAPMLVLGVVVTGAVKVMVRALHTDEESNNTAASCGLPEACAVTKAMLSKRTVVGFADEKVVPELRKSEAVPDEVRSAAEEDWNLKMLFETVADAAK